MFSLNSPAIWIAALPTAYLTLVSAYLLMVTIGAWLYRPRLVKDAPLLKTVILIPAHDEADGIGPVVGEALQLDYPRDLFEIVVIADNCSDDTAARAREAGATVLERHDADNRGKGQALDWCLNTYRDRWAAFDLISFIDADMEINSQYLRALSQQFADEGVRVVQTLYRISKPERHWRTALGFMSFAVVNHVRPAGRCWLGGTAELKGSGMAFRRDLILERGWPAHTLTEDMEFARLLLLDGVRVDYNPAAVVSSEIPVQRAQADVQQRRWEGGKLYLVKTYLPKFARAWLRRPSRALADAVCDTLVPPISILVLLAVLCFGLSLLIHEWWTLVVALDAAAIGALIATGLVQLKAPLRVWLYLAAVPIFLAWKLPLLLRLFVRRGPTSWERTPRDSEVGRGSSDSS